MRALKTCLLAVGLLSFMLLVYTSPTDAAAAADKKTLDNYKQHCLKCHGEQGKGDGPVTKTVKNMKMSD